MDGDSGVTGFGLALGVPFFRGGGVTPIDPHTLGNRVLEYDAFDNSGLYTSVAPNVPATDGQTVTAWQDLSTGATKSALQTTAGNKGIARDLGGFWALDFDGGDDFYTIQDSGIPGSTFVSCTVYSVLTPDTLTSETVVSSSSAAGAGFQDRYSNPQILRNDVEIVATATNAPTAGTRFVDAVTYNGSLFNFYRNGATNGSTSKTSTFTAATNRLGATVAGLEPYNGYMHYLVIFSAVHDAATLAGVQAFLKTRWQIA